MIEARSKSSCSPKFGLGLGSSSPKSGARALRVKYLNGEHSYTRGLCFSPLYEVLGSPKKGGGGWGRVLAPCIRPSINHSPGLFYQAAKLARARGQMPVDI